MRNVVICTSDVIAGKIILQMGMASVEEVRGLLREIEEFPAQNLDLVNRLFQQGRLNEQQINFVRHRVALYEHVRNEAVYVRLMERGTTIQKESVAKLLAQLERSAFRRRLGDVLVRRGNLKPEYDQQIVRKQMRMVHKDNKRILDRYRKEDFAGVQKPLIPNSQLEPHEFKISTLFRSKETRVLVDKAEIALLRAEAEAAAELEREAGGEDDTMILSGLPPGVNPSDPALVETTKLPPGMASGTHSTEGGIPDAIPDPTPVRSPTAQDDEEDDEYEEESEETGALPVAPAAGDGFMSIEQVKNLQRIEDYTVVETLGVGGMGAVFLGQKDGAGEFVAIKVLLNQAATDEEKGRFHREVDLTQRVKHSNVIGIIDAGETAQGLSFMVVPALAGKELRDLMGSSPHGLAPPLALKIFEQVLLGMKACHDEGIVHRDMKPENVFVRAGGMHEIIIMDFGLAKPADVVEAEIDVFRTQGGENVSGSPAYIAPESVTNDPIDGRTDIYSIGIMFFEMLTGELPLSSETSSGYLTQHLICPPLTLKEARPEIAWPDELESLLDRMMGKTRDERPATCQAILDEFAGGLGSIIERIRSVSEEEESAVAEALAEKPPEEKGRWGFKGLLGRLIGD